MVAISPTKLAGPWAIGYALDVQTMSSTYLGDNEYGHPRFDTQRSELGELLYRLKYRGDRSVIAVIADTATAFVQQQKWTVDLVVPVPPSRDKRAFQPVHLVAEAIASELGAGFGPDCIVKVRSTPELKGVYQYDERIALLRDVYAVARTKVASKKVLLFDDLYRSGATIKSTSQALRAKGEPQRIYALTLTRTRRRR